MMFSEESHYGWGVFGIKMPRAAHDIYSRIFIDDFKWVQTLLLSFLSAMALVSMPVIKSVLPRPQEEQLSKPVEIIISVIDEQDRSYISPIKEKPLSETDYDQVEQNVVAKQSAEKAQPVTVTEPDEAKRTLNVEKEGQVPKKLLPDKRRKTGIGPNLLKAPVTIASTTLPSQTQPEREMNTISPPTFDQSKYTSKADDRVLQRRRSDVMPNFIPGKKKKPAVSIVHADRLRRKYKSAGSNPEKSRTAGQIPSTDDFAFNRLVETARVGMPTTDQSDHLSALKEKASQHSMQGAPVSSDQQVSFGSLKPRENPMSKPQTQARSYSTRSAPLHSESQKILRGTELPALQEQITGLDLTQPKRRLSNERYIFNQTANRQSQPAQSADQEFPLQPRKRQESLLPIPPSSTKSLSKDSRPPKNSSTSSARAPDFSVEFSPDEIDPSQLTSLSEFKVCTDPEKEFRLKTQLAMRLDRPTWIESSGVLFFCKYPESGYTMQVGIYNPRGRPFTDRCEVLQLALNAILNMMK